MARDYSRFLPGTVLGSPSQKQPNFLETLGWQSFFAQQISADDMMATPPARIVEVHRSGLHILGAGIDSLLPPNPDATVGDWVLFDQGRPNASRVLERKSLFKRRAPGTNRQIQLIAANVDTAFIVSSCNQDFNIARLERYIALAFEADVTPVILLTKSDLCDSAEAYKAAAQEISDKVTVISLDARGEEPQQKLADWCATGQTIAFLGSSGVGKSTLVNALSGTQTVATQAIREDDSKGRHTTTRRQLHLVPEGCLVLDTPGMRELQLVDADMGIAGVFEDLQNLAAQCRFADCRHETEPGCAVQAAVAAGHVDAARFARWQKLLQEEHFNTASMAERRAKDKALSKLVKVYYKQKKAMRPED